MKAIVYSDSADVLRCAEIDNPVPADDEILVRVVAAAVNPADWRVAFAPKFIRRIVVQRTKARVDRPGHDLSGIVEAVGRNVTRFRPGDEVFGAASGAFAEYACATESHLARKPANVSFDDAAAVPVAGLTALQGLRDHGHLQPGHKVLINGAAGGVGTYAVQIAKTLGTHVTGVCSTRNVDMVYALGADRVIDYTREDFTRLSDRYDLLLDNVANRSHSDLLRVVSPTGWVIVAGAPKSSFAVPIRLLGSTIRSKLLRQPLKFFMARITSTDLETLAQMMASGKLKSVLDRRYELSSVPDALRYVQEGHARAKVVISISPAPLPVAANHAKS